MASPTLDNAKMAAATKLRSPNILATIDAVAAPRIQQSDAPDDIEYERALAQDTVAALSAMGHPTTQRETIGDVQALMFDGGNIIAVADPRHRGAAGGF